MKSRILSGNPDPQNQPGALGTTTRGDQTKKNWISPLEDSGATGGGIEGQRISKLPSPCSRQLLASQTLITTAAVVKELLDNAIDAGARRIAVEVSDNLLDVLQVRDDGIGIGGSENQRKAVGRWGWTSKHGLSSSSGMGPGVSPGSLGFRGEALASLAELSKEVCVTSRSGGDDHGWRWVIGSDNPATVVPATRGTTVRVKSFLFKLPVRRSAAINNRSQNMGILTKMMHAYALARPTVQFSLRVIQCEDLGKSWSSGSNSTSVRDVALNTVGNSCVAHCEQISLAEMRDSYASSGEESSHLLEGYDILALLPRPDANPRNISKHGQYISVDGRPLNTGRGFAKKVVGLFTKTLRNCPDLGQASNPFLALDLRCPKNSYDVNVEPLKDDVIFADYEQMMTCVQYLFAKYYSHAHSLITPSFLLPSPAQTPLGSSMCQSPGRSREYFSRILQESREGKVEIQGRADPSDPGHMETLASARGERIRYFPIGAEKQMMGSKVQRELTPEGGFPTVVIPAKTPGPGTGTRMRCQDEEVSTSSVRIWPSPPELPDPDRRPTKIVRTMGIVSPMCSSPPSEPHLGSRIHQASRWGANRESPNPAYPSSPCVSLGIRRSAMASPTRCYRPLDSKERRPERKPAETGKYMDIRTALRNCKQAVGRSAVGRGEGGEERVLEPGSQTMVLDHIKLSASVASLVQAARIIGRSSDLVMRWDLSAEEMWEATPSHWDWARGACRDTEGWRNRLASLLGEGFGIVGRDRGLVPISSGDRVAPALLKRG